MRVLGGIPHVRRATVDTTGAEVSLPSWIGYLIVRNKGANVAKLYFTQTDYTAGTNYVTIPVAAATDPHGEWAGPVHTDADKYGNLYLQGVGGNATVEIVAFQRR
jgi:hypothetical protein